MKQIDPLEALHCVDSLSLSSKALGQIMTAVLREGADFRFRAKGFSMYPCIRERDILTLTPVANMALCIGDVAAYVRRDTGRPIVHRIIAHQGERCLLQGDNVDSPDGWVEREDIVGIVQRIERDGEFITFGLGVERIPLAWLNRRRRLRYLLIKLMKAIVVC